MAFYVEVPRIGPSVAITHLGIGLFKDVPVLIVHLWHGNLHFLIEEIVTACCCLSLFCYLITRSRGRSKEISIFAISRICHRLIRIDYGTAYLVPFYLSNRTHVRCHQQIETAILVFIKVNDYAFLILLTSSQGPEISNRCQQLA